MRFKLSDLLMFSLLFIFVAAFPVDLIKVSYFYRLLITCGLRLLLVAFYIYLIIKYQIKVFKIANLKNLLLCVPFVIICFSNLIAASIDGGFIGLTMTGGELAILIFYHLITAVIEEILFRLFIHNAIYASSSIKRIILSATIFALMHLIQIVNVSNIDALVTLLIQTVYTFGLGLLLGYLYEFSHSLVGSICLHFLFNFFNTVLYLYLGGYASNIAFYVTAAVTAIIAGVYAVVIYLTVLRKYNRYFRS